MIRQWAIAALVCVGFVTSADAIIRRPPFIHHHQGDPTINVLPSYNDAYANWKNAGLATVGGVSAHEPSTKCGSTVNPVGGGGDDFSNIQNAITACTVGEYVQLGSGAFSIHVADLPIEIPKGIVLRGTGSCSGSSSPYCSTVISVSDGALQYVGATCGNTTCCGTTTASETSCPNGGPPAVLMSPLTTGGFDWDYSWAQCGNQDGAGSGVSCGAVLLATDAAQGQATIQIAQTSAFSVGEWVLIDEASNAGWVADPLASTTGNTSVWATSDWLNSSGSPATGRYMWNLYSNGGGDFGGGQYPTTQGAAGCWYSYCDRATAEIHVIKSIGVGPCPGTNCTLTFDDPLTIAFRQSGGHNAQVYPGLYPDQGGTGNNAISFLQYAGLENLSLLRAPNGTVEVEFCAYCWVHNVEIGNWFGGPLELENAVRTEINGVYIHHCWFCTNNGGEYPLSIDRASTEVLITNSITNFAGKGMVARAGGAGSVVSYNYQDDTMYDSYSGIGDYWVEMGLNASHYAGPHHVLFEGNWGDNLDQDHTHGSGEYVTFFRNLGSGLRTPFIDPSIPAGQVVNDFTGVGYACTVTGPTGCSLNAPGPLRAAGPSAYNYWFAFVGNVLGVSDETTAAHGWSYQGDWSSNRIWMLGWNNGPGGEDPYLDGVNAYYLFRHGDYDYYNSSIADWASGYSHALPNSFYLSSAPSFFSGGASCTYPWPWVTPTGSSPFQTNSCSGSGLPAQARWNAGTPFVQP